MNIIRSNLKNYLDLSSQDHVLGNDLRKQEIEDKEEIPEMAIGNNVLIVHMTTNGKNLNIAKC